MKGTHTFIQGGAKIFKSYGGLPPVHCYQCCNGGETNKPFRGGTGSPRPGTGLKRAHESP